MGPQDYRPDGAKDLEARLRAVREAERERCARIAEDWDWYTWIKTGPHEDEGHIDFRGSMKQLAAEIRKPADQPPDATKCSGRHGPGDCPYHERRADVCLCWEKETGKIKVCPVHG